MCVCVCGGGGGGVASVLASLSRRGNGRRGEGVSVCTTSCVDKGELLFVFCFVNLLVC